MRELVTVCGLMRGVLQGRMEGDLAAEWAAALGGGQQADAQDMVGGCMGLFAVIEEKGYAQRREIKEGRTPHPYTDKQDGAFVLYAADFHMLPAGSTALINSQAQTHADTTQTHTDTLTRLQLLACICH